MMSFFFFFKQMLADCLVTSQFLNQDGDATVRKINKKYKGTEKQRIK